MKTVVIVGVGALGSHTTLLLRNVKATLKIVDMDSVESKNIQSQFHGKPGIGKPKVLALSGAMNLLFGLKLETNSNKLVENNAAQILGGADLVLDCLDNAASRRVIQTYVRANGVPCLHGAVDAEGTFGRVCWDESFVIDEEGTPGTPTCEDGEHLPFLSLVASYLAHSAKEFLAKNQRIGYQISLGGTIRT